MMQEIPESKIKTSSVPKSPQIKPAAPSLLRQLKRLDIYQKLDENYRVQTSLGAILSLVGWVVIAILVLAEINNYLTPSFKEHMVVDTSLGQQLRININITFHALTCVEAHLDAMDVAGDNQLNIEHEMIKQRLTHDGKPIGKAGIEIIGEKELQAHPPLAPDYCGDCYGAETDTEKCCNTCDDLIKAYQRKQWSTDRVIRNSTQCQRDRAELSALVNPDEGCTISGMMKVNKVAGNFHIAHGESVVRDGKHIHQFNPLLAPKFNVSHTIHSISFGHPYPSMPSNPLDNVHRIIKADENTGLFQYFIRVIPTIYTDESNNKIYTNQYTLTDRFRPLIVPPVDIHAPPQHTEAILPGIFFIYELSPFMIEASRMRMPLLHLLTKLCAIIGGVFTVLGVLDSVIFRLQKLLFGSK
mmetsp:Transcript_27358/g.38860  ORF Transcript_27358/g.38860 Transcript_27358/m.38860 type:complete len:413 (-) Transcript_27358:93-1331(-)